MYDRTKGCQQSSNSEAGTVDPKSHHHPDADTALVEFVVDEQLGERDENRRQIEVGTETHEEVIILEKSAEVASRSNIKAEGTALAEPEARC
mmetsp:Transcript_49087/g.104489  ORF Transcript_49087/g.104489 Transcript_49087/m.104489 type:complete len:92 (+) Transcript_49087:444-719(+)